MMHIRFSPPDITQREIDEVVDTLKSGWITTGPKTKRLEKLLSERNGTMDTVCLNSATSGLELILRYLGIGEGDEVITCAYTYTASASVIDHVGAKIVLADCQKNSFIIDYDDLENKITENTKAIIPVDIAGVMADYDRIFEIVEKKKALFKPKNQIQKSFGRIIVVADAAHSLGARYKNKLSGSVADFTSFSFHAVKNFTTAEGGAITWKINPILEDYDLYKEFMLLALHGQSKDALSKMSPGAWEYDIVYTGYKANMTDINAAIGLAQFERYPDLLKRRAEIIKRYSEGLKKDPNIKIFSHSGETFESSKHLFMLNILDFTEEQRNIAIGMMADRGVATNVHYKPLPMFTAYKNLGFKIKDYPNAKMRYKNELTLPLHTLLTDEEVDYIIKSFLEVVEIIRSK